MSKGYCEVFLVSLSFMSATLGLDRNASAGFSSDGFTNSATVGDGIVFNELNVNPNTRRANDKPAITKVMMSDPARGPSPFPVHLHVTGDRLSASDDTNGTITIYQGKTLRGLAITIAMCDGREYELTMNDVQEVPDVPVSPALPLTPSPVARFWVAPMDEVETYDFVVRKTSRQHPLAFPCGGTVAPVEDGRDSPLPPPDAVKEHLCKGPFHSADDLWTRYEAALAFEGDYFDPTKNDQTPPPGSPGWFNLACDGTAAAKMHLLRHTQASGTSTRRTTPDQRTAMLKAITADYCGDGGLGTKGVDARVWTADGTPLFWTDEKAWFPDATTRIDDLGKVFSGTWEIEAIWGPQGAICLNEPRRTPDKSAKCPGPLKVPAVERREVEDYCIQTGLKLLPRCTDTYVTWFLGRRMGHVMTVRKTDQSADYCRS